MPPSHAAEKCKNCMRPVKMMVQKGTGFCSQKCDREGLKHSLVVSRAFPPAA